MNDQSPIDPLTGRPASIAIQIATELNFGVDPQVMNPKQQLLAIEAASHAGQEEFVSVLIALLPIELREAAAQGWDYLN